MSFGVENLTWDPRLERLLLTRSRDSDPVVSLNSDTAIAFCLSVLHRLDVDWKLHAYDSTALHERAEITLRTVQSC